MALVCLCTCVERATGQHDQETQRTKQTRCLRLPPCVLIDSSPIRGASSSVGAGGFSTGGSTSSAIGSQWHAWELSASTTKVEFRTELMDATLRQTSAHHYQTSVYTCVAVGPHLLCSRPTRSTHHLSVCPCCPCPCPCCPLSAFSARQMM